MFLQARLTMLALILGAAVGGRLAWWWQAKELERQAAGYEQQLAAKDLKYSREREDAAEAALGQLQEQQKARRALEDRLQVQDQTHWKEMNDAQQAQARLRDRLATADLRLSVLFNVKAQGGSGRVPATAGAGGLVHGAARAELDPATAQRIIGITGDGDQGLIALAACQDHVKEIVSAK
jgi:hypothetical protein